MARWLLVAACLVALAGGSAAAKAKRPPTPATKFAKLIDFLDSNSYSNFSSIIQTTSVGDFILAGFKSGEAFTVFAPPDSVLGADFAYPDYCLSARNYDVDSATAQSTGGLHVVSGLFPSADITDLGPGTQFFTLTPAVLTLLNGPPAIGVLNGFNKPTTKAVITTPDVYSTPWVVVHGISTIMKYPQVV